MPAPTQHIYLHCLLRCPQHHLGWQVSSPTDRGGDGVSEPSAGCKWKSLSLAPGLYDTSTTGWNDGGLSLASSAIPCSFDPPDPSVDIFTFHQPRILAALWASSLQVRGEGSTDGQLALLQPRELQSTRGRRPATSSTFTPLRRWALQVSDGRFLEKE